MIEICHTRYNTLTEMLYAIGRTKSDVSLSPITYRDDMGGAAYTNFKITFNDPKVETLFRISYSDKIQTRSNIDYIR